MANASSHNYTVNVFTGVFGFYVTNTIGFDILTQHNLSLIYCFHTINISISHLQTEKNLNKTACRSFEMAQTENERQQVKKSGAVSGSRDVRERRDETDTESAR